MKKIIVTIISIVIIGCVAGGYYLYKSNKVKTEPVKQESLQEPKKEDFTNKTDKEVYIEKEKAINSSISITDDDVIKYMSKNDIQYPAKKLTTEDANKNKSHIFIDGGSTFLDKKHSKGEKTEYGLFVSLEELTDEDKKEVVKALLYNNKVDEAVKDYREGIRK